MCVIVLESRSFPVYRGRFPVHCSSMSRSKGLNCSNDWTRLYVNIYNRPPSAWGVHILSLSMPVQSLRLFELNALLILCQYCLITWSRVLFLSLCVFIVQNISLNSVNILREGGFTQFYCIRAFSFTPLNGVDL